MARMLPFLFVALVSVPLAACGGGGDGNGGGGGPVPNTPAAEVEPNDGFATATAVSASVSGMGTIGVGDQDWWAFSASMGTLIRVELHAIRNDQATWDANANDPILTLFDTTGAAKILEHDRLAEGWPHGVADLDFPIFRIPVSGNYFLRVAASVPGNPGGNYVVLVKVVSVPPLFQTEAETPGVDGLNNTVPTAEAIAPGTVFGYHVDGGEDDYAFTLVTPAIVSFEVVAYRNGLFAADTGLMDLALDLLPPGGGVPIISGDDTFLKDPGLTYLILTGGTYVLRVRENLASTGDGAYFLLFSRVDAPLVSSEAEPNDMTATASPIFYGVTRGDLFPLDTTDIYQFPATAGDVLNAQLYDASNAEMAFAGVSLTLLDPAGVALAQSSGPNLAVTRAICQTTGNHFVRVTGAIPTAYWFRLSRVLTSAREGAPNDTPATATPMGTAPTFSGVVNPGGDQDFFSITASAGEVVTIDCLGAFGLNFPWAEQDFDTYGSTMLPHLRIFDAVPVQIAQSLLSPPGGVASTQSLTEGLPSVAVTFVAPVDGTYFVAVNDQPLGGSASQVYVLRRR